VPPWKQYQERVAQLFRELGCDVKTDCVVEGARGPHDIDVSVRFVRFGLHQHWIVECKLWTRRVSKLNVAALQKIVENVGADRGLLIAEAGHQSGAHIAAKNTNISLISLADLRESAKAELLSLGFSEVRRRATVMKRYTLSLWEEVRTGPFWKSHPKPGIDAALAINIGSSASFIDHGAEEAQLGHFPIVLVVRDDVERAVQANDLEEFVEAASAILDNLDSMVVKLNAQATGSPPTKQDPRQ
jgi:hypothetical protein